MAKRLLIVCILFASQVFGGRADADIDFDETLSAAEHDASCALLFWFLGSTKGFKINEKPIPSEEFLETSHQLRLMAYNRVQSLPEDQRSGAHKIMVTARHKAMLEMTKLIRSDDRAARTERWIKDEFVDCKAKAPGVAGD